MQKKFCNLYKYIHTHTYILINISFVLHFRYKALLEVNGQTLPDPLSVLTNGWVGEARGMESWPPCMYGDMTRYLIAKGQYHQNISWSRGLEGTVEIQTGQPGHTL